MCANCAVAEPESAPNASAAPLTPPPPSPIMTAKTLPALPPWGWIIFGVLMLLIFGGIIYFPAMKARFLGRKLGVRDPEQAGQAATELARMGGTPALNELVRTAETAKSIQNRIIAVDALSRIHHRDALTMLQRIASAPDTPDKVRLAAKDAIAMQERLTNR